MFTKAYAIRPQLFVTLAVADPNAAPIIALDEN
jgi:hypothetical protein